MRKITAVLLCILVVFSVSGCSDNNIPEEITLLTLDSYLSPDSLKEFTETTGIKVNNITASSYEEIQEMVEKDPSCCDLIIACDYVLNSLVKGNFLQEIDYKKFEHSKYVIPGYTGKYYDPENKFTVPFAAIGVLIGYNPYEAGIIIDSYADLLAPDLEGSVVFPDDPSIVVGISNIILGETPHTIADPNKTVKILNSLAKNNHILSENSLYPEDALVKGEASVGVLYTSQLGYAVASNPEIEVVYPKEGFFASIDGLAIPSGADGKEFAMEFINYVHDPVINGKLAQEIVYSSANISGKQFMDEEYRNEGYNIKNDKAEECILFPEQDEKLEAKFRSLYKNQFIKKSEALNNPQPTDDLSQ